MTTPTKTRAKTSASATIKKLRERLAAQKIEVNQLSEKLATYQSVIDNYDPLAAATAGTEVSQELYETLSSEGINFAGGKLFATVLQPRHAEFLERAAEREGRTLGQMIERLVRIGYAQDPYKAGAVDPETENGFSGRASDMKIG
jgi:hypothetical protein